MDEAILTTLYSAGGDYATHQRLCESAGATKDIICERLEGLKALGYVIENHPQLGCRILGSPDRLMAEDLRARLSGAGGGMRPGQIGNKILVFEKTTSTSDVVQRLASEGHSEGLVVFAESQTGGRGRHGRKWISPSRKGLWFSVLLRPQFGVDLASRLTIGVAVAVATSLRRETMLPLSIKWPNDILYNGKKVAGILLELSLHAEKIEHAIVGIGIDVNLREKDFPEELRPIATSLSLESGKEFLRPALVTDLLMELESCLGLLKDEFPKILNRWESMDATLGKQISVQRGNNPPLKGFAMSLESDGTLLVRTDHGHIERVSAGEITIERTL